MKMHGNQVSNQKVKVNGVGTGLFTRNQACVAKEIAHQGTMPMAPACYVGCQKGTDRVEDLDLYNLMEDIPGFVQWSTVSGRTLRRAGYRLPPRIPDRRHEHALVQIRQLSELFSR